MTTGGPANTSEFQDGRHRNKREPFILREPSRSCTHCCLYFSGQSSAPWHYLVAREGARKQSFFFRPRCVQLKLECLTKEKWQDEYEGPSCLALIGITLHGFESWLSCLLPLSCWRIHPLSLNLGFIICNMAIIITSPFRAVVKTNNTRKDLSTVPGIL